MLQILTPENLVARLWIIILFCIFAGDFIIYLDGMRKDGKLIAAFGLPGSGKSSTTREIGKLLGIKTFHEPEEKDWGDAVKMRDKTGKFSSLMWFRATRIPLIYMAEEEKKQGKITMLDSFYDKLFHLYHDKKGIEWFYNKEDLYYDEMVNIALKDYKFLPDADIIVFFKMDEETWKKFIGQRMRNLDQDEEFNKSFILQNAMITAIEKYSNDSNCKLIIHEQTFSSPHIEAEKIAAKIRKLLDEDI